MKNIIGAKYIPQDNSYSRNLSNDKQDAQSHLAGTKWAEAIIVTIITNPFPVYIKSFCTKKYYFFDFVLVLTDEKETHFIMYHEHGLITENRSVYNILSKMQFANPSEF